MDALAQVIEGARKEGVIAGRLSTNLNIPLQQRLVQEIEEAYGVRLRLEYTAAKGYAKEAATVLGEYKAGISIQDLTTFSGGNMMKLIDAGAIQPVDWLPLLPQGTPPDIILPGGFGVNVYTQFNGIIYNPGKVAAGEVPKTWRDLAHPKWKGRIGIRDARSDWVFLAYLRGWDESLETLRAIMKNKPIVGEPSSLQNRYEIGEIDLYQGMSNDTQRLELKKVPAKFTSLDFSGHTSIYVLVTRYAQHPNAAKLVAAYLAGPKGLKIRLEAGGGTLFYPGNSEHDLALKNKERGLPSLSFDSDARFRAFEMSPETDKFSEEVARIWMTGK
ncbi:MAG: extracellular solute-binding protein [Chloroflexi bacterium]|nr:extracellular solute-binding protein [Chloroflexota bacterium]